MGNDMTRRSSSDVVAQPPVSVPTPLEEVIGSLKDAITSMAPDDLVLEIATVQDGRGGSSGRLSLRAYRHRKMVLNEEHEVK